MAKKMTGKNTGQKGKTEIKTAGAEILLRRTLNFISITPPQNFLAYYTGPEGKLQCILFPRKRRISAVLLVYSA